MNNIFLPNDPLLFNLQQADYRQLYEQKLMKEREIFDKQYNEYMKNAIQKPQMPDKVTELNDTLKELTPELKAELENNAEFVLLNLLLLQNVQYEIMQLVKNNINSNPSLVDNINKLIQMITEISNKVKDLDRKNMALINDYLKNYSDMTFDEYKKIKNI